METDKSNARKASTKKAVEKPREEKPSAGPPSPKKPDEEKPSAAPASKAEMGQVFRTGEGWVEVRADSPEYKAAKAFGRARPNK